jgi:hypothetical protein
VVVLPPAPLDAARGKIDVAVVTTVAVIALLVEGKVVLSRSEP